MADSPREPIVAHSRRRLRGPEFSETFELPSLEGETTRESNGRENLVPVDSGSSGESHTAEAELVPVHQKEYLGLFSTSALILNKIIGTGIYESPKIVLSATGSKGISLIIWIIGCIMAWAGLYVYLEYGMRWPVMGGELYYVDNLSKKPRRLLTYIFASMFVLVNGVQANSLQFGSDVIMAGSSYNGQYNQNLQKFFAIMITTFVCQLLAYSRFIYVRICNTLAVLKVIALVFITVCGLVALTGARRHGGDEIQTSYGKADLANAFATRSNDPYQYALALLSVMRAFLGYENANFVLTEVRVGPDGDERQVFRRAVKTSVFTCCFLYIMVNVAFFAVCTTEEILNSPQILEIFLQKIFNVSQSAHVASGITIAFSSVGAIIASTFSNVRVKQEIGRIGVLPFPEYWSKTSHRRTPAHALFLHWIFSVLCILITPLDNPAGFLIISTLYSYVHTWISILLGVCLLAAPWISAFRFEDGPWKPQSSSWEWWLLAPLTVIYVASNAFVLILSWFPANLQTTLNTTAETLPYYTGPVTGLALIGFGIIWWTWDVYILRWFGYEFWAEEDDPEYSHKWKVDVLRVNFHRKLTGPAKKMKDACTPAFMWLRNFMSRDSN
ncbi:amino acid transporter [Glonium stellatum]|uniref:Amino acid transporter n=1 Tax=Glonium stellatum TaxID=574774 RepID=A0A8E2JM00_9PEZI|nr:amino acid transporter [Glonium stellatum]